MNFGVQHEEDETGIELTPLIDVVFLLLIFFMISTTFTKETSLKINLPEANGDAAIDQPKSVEVQIGADSQYAIQLSTEGSSRALINSNRSTLKSALAEFKDNPSLLLIVRADRKSPHDAMIRVLDVAQELGLSNITFATKQTTQ
jgi:Biopolymer transport protein